MKVLQEVEHSDFIKSIKSNPLSLPDIRLRFKKASSRETLFDFYEDLTHIDSLSSIDKYELLDQLTKNKYLYPYENPLSLLIDFFITRKKQELFCLNRFLSNSFLNQMGYGLSSHITDILITGSEEQKNFVYEHVISVLQKEKKTQHNIHLYVALNDLPEGQEILKLWPSISSQDILFADKTGLNVRFSTWTLLDNVYAGFNNMEGNIEKLFHRQIKFMAENQKELEEDQKIYFYIVNYLAHNVEVFGEKAFIFEKIKVDFSEDISQELNGVTLQSYIALLNAKKQNAGNEFKDYLQGLENEYIVNKEKAMIKKGLADSSFIPQINKVRI